VRRPVSAKTKKPNKNVRSTTFLLGSRQRETRGLAPAHKPFLANSPIFNARIPSVPAGRLWHLVCIALRLFHPKSRRRRKNESEKQRQSRTVIRRHSRLMEWLRFEWESETLENPKEKRNESEEQPQSRAVNRRGSRLIPGLEPTWKQDRNRHSQAREIAGRQRICGGWRSLRLVARVNFSSASKGSHFRPLTK
jgi:hypothetical protein